MTGPDANAGSTKARLLEAAEALFIEHGFEAMSLRQITSRAGANLAAVNYHFGSKESLIHELLHQRLDRLNQERLRLLSACEAHYGEGRVDAPIVLAALFVPALRLGQGAAEGPTFVRLLGRVYSDTSPFMRNYLREHYEPIFGRFFEAFSRALPHLSRNELGMRLHFCLKALSGVLAGEDMDELIATLCMGEPISDAVTIARLIAFISPILTEPFVASKQTSSVEQVMGLADAVTRDAGPADAIAPAADTGKTPGVLPLWAVKVMEI